MKTRPAQHAVVNGVDFCAHLLKDVAREDVKEFASDFLFPGNAQHAVVDGLKERALGIFPEVLFGQSEAELVQLLCCLGKARV